MKINKYWIYVIAGLLVLSLVLPIFTELSILESLRIFFGSLYVLFLPGYVISFIFFKEKQIDNLERITLSFALSIAIVPLVIFYLNLIGVKINLLNSFLTVFGIFIISLLILKLNGIYYSRRRT